MVYTCSMYYIYYNNDKNVNNSESLIYKCSMYYIYYNNYKM
jgi:hypothetical protein